MYWLVAKMRRLAAGARYAATVTLPDGLPAWGASAARDGWKRRSATSARPTGSCAGRERQTGRPRRPCYCGGCGGHSTVRVCGRHRCCVAVLRISAAVDARAVSVLRRGRSGYPGGHCARTAHARTPADQQYHGEEPAWADCARLRDRDRNHSHWCDGKRIFLVRYQRAPVWLVRERTETALAARGWTRHLDRTTRQRQRQRTERGGR